MTAPELGRFFARSVAALGANLLAGSSAPAILELGAGTGRLASQVLDELDRLGIPNCEYRILEPSADLRARQQETLSGRAEQLAWLDGMPEQNGFAGLVLANEVLDALPVARFRKQNGRVLPLGVGLQDGRFVSLPGDEDSALTAAVARLEASLGEPLPEPFESEINMLLPSWLHSLADSLSRGAVLLTDYGMVRREYYHPERATGTLICHYRHRAHTNYFRYPGLTDISAWVDFSACADAAADAGMALAGFTTQANFIVSSLESLAREEISSYSPAELGALKTLVLPGEMGERFKVMLLTHDTAPLSLPGRDLRNWL